MLDALPNVGAGESADGFTTVKEFLGRYGYLDPALSLKAAGMETADLLDEDTSLALGRYQAFHGLHPSGVFDEATKEMMSRSRCGVPDIDPASPMFATTCAWNRDSLTYAFGAGTGDVSGDDEREAVRRAFRTWSAATQFAFREVGTGDSPDIVISWGNASCGDADMTGSTLAHADYPPGCGYYGNALPRPIHFDDQEHAWCVGAVASQYDVETVALHEIGHILGMLHSSVSGAVMFPTASTNATLRALSPDDLEGIRRRYPIRGPVFARHSGKCLDIEGVSTANGADAIQWEYWGGGNQLFRVEWVEASHYRLIAQHSGRVLDVDAISPSNGAQIHQWDWWGGDNQKFRLDPVGHGYYRATAKHSGKCLDVAGISSANGARVTQWDWWGGYNQQWRLGPALIASRHSGKALDIEGISLVNGARAIQWDYWGGGNQKFRLDPVGDGYYRIMVEHSGKCLDVAGISTANGAEIIQWEYWGGDNQKFRPEPTGDGYYRLVARHSGKCLDVSGISAANGARIVQWDWWGGNNQQWRL
ncbi:MAG TPA: RICIN domain-containing protein [Micromonosporaceae bacterium]|nr:RICIN domain-containing protein [Micromonosporaceae bacterium]